MARKLPAYITEILLKRAKNKTNNLSAGSSIYFERNIDVRLMSYLVAEFYILKVMNMYCNKMRSSSTSKAVKSPYNH